MQNDANKRSNHGKIGINLLRKIHGHVSGHCKDDTGNHCKQSSLQLIQQDSRSTIIKYMWHGKFA